MPDYHSFSAYVCKDTTFLNLSRWKIKLWIALKFFVLLQSKQPGMAAQTPLTCCELLSNFLYFCSRNNVSYYEVTQWGCELLSNFLYFCSRNNFCNNFIITRSVVNCSQIFCTFAVETTTKPACCISRLLWIALKFFVLLQSKQHHKQRMWMRWVVNCSQIFCTFAVETTAVFAWYSQ